MKEQRERRILILMRAALFAVGAVLGALAMGQALDAIVFKFPVAAVVLFYIASALVLGGLFALSAKPFRAAFHTFSSFIRKKFKAVKVVDVAGVSLGLVVGIACAFTSEFIFKLFLQIVAVRFLIDGVIGLLAAFLTAIGVSGWLGSDAAEPGENPLESLARAAKGYLLTEAALENPKIVNLCRLWLDGNIYVLSRTADAMAERAERENGNLAAYENFKLLYAAKTVKILEFLTEADPAAAYLDAAEAKKLKLIAAASERTLLETKRPVLVLPLEDI